MKIKFGILKPHRQLYFESIAAFLISKNSNKGYERKI